MKEDKKLKIIKSDNKKDDDLAQHETNLEEIKERLGTKKGPIGIPNRKEIIKMIDGETVIGTVSSGDPIGLITVKTDRIEDFVKKVNRLILNGYKVMSAYCGNEKDDFEDGEVVYICLLLMHDDYIMSM